jgi:hypothetical protein
MRISEILESKKDTKESPKSPYLGPTTKVKINKKGMQVPLNKKGFGA